MYNYYYQYKCAMTSMTYFNLLNIVGTMLFIVHTDIINIKLIINGF